MRLKTPTHLFIRDKARAMVLSWYQQMGDTDTILYASGVLLERIIAQGLVDMCTVERRER